MTSWAQDRRLELVFDKTLDTVHQRLQKVKPHRHQPHYH